MKVQRGVVAVVMAVGVGMWTTVPAHAEVSPHCKQQGYCLFSATQFGGVKASAAIGNGCKPVSALGFATARSAARGFGDGAVLELYSDSSCTSSLGFVDHEVPVTSAKSYQVHPIPS